MGRQRSPVYVIETSPIPYNVGCSTQHFLTSLPAKQRESGGHSKINEEAYFCSLEWQVSGLEQTVPLIAPILKYPLQKGWTVTCSKAFGHPVKTPLQLIADRLRWKGKNPLRKLKRQHKKHKTSYTAVLQQKCSRSISASSR